VQRVFGTTAAGTCRFDRRVHDEGVTTARAGRGASDAGIARFELLVVLGIVGVLGGIVLLGIPMFTERADSSACVQDRRMLERAIDGAAARPKSLADATADELSDDVVGNRLVRRSYTISYDPASGALSSCTSALAEGGSKAPDASDTAAVRLTGVSGGDGDGVLEQGDVLRLSFSAPVALHDGDLTTVRLRRSGEGDAVVLAVPDVLAGRVVLPGGGWLPPGAPREATFSATVAVSGATVTVTVGRPALRIDAPVAGPPGAVAFVPATGITGGGEPVTGRFVTPKTFRLF
jgi:type II secretory pathway pseudopilin PulG